MHTTKHVATLFNVSTETVRVYATEFSRYLSPTATPVAGRHRRYTDDDLQVFALVAELKGQGLTYEDCHAALSAGQRGDIDMPATQISVQDNALAVHEQLLALQTQVTRLEALLEAAIDRAERAEQRLERELAAARDEIIRLNRENVRLEVQRDSKG